MDNHRGDIQYYEDLIDSMISGYAFHEAVYDENGVFVSFKYLAINKKKL